MRQKRFVAVCIIVFTVLAVIRGTRDEAAVVGYQPYHADSRMRQPVKIEVLDGGKLLLVANRKSGSISVVDAVSQGVVSETVVGKQLADMVIASNERHAFVADEGADEVIVLRRQGHANLKTIGRVKVNSSPVSLSLSDDGTKLYVASLWARRLSIVDITSAKHPAVVGTVDLPFAPRKQRFLPDNKHLIVADAFGGQLAVVDVTRQALIATRDYDAHNMRGLGIGYDDSAILIPHQALMSDNATTQGGVHWGAVMMNVIRTIPIQEVLKEPTGPRHAAKLYYLGSPDEAAGDPTDLLVTGDQRQIVAYAGTSEIAISEPEAHHFSRTAVGRRPTALALSPEHDRVYVANTLSDSISVVDVKTSQVAAEISLGPRPELTLVDRGEELFHDAHLSSDGWFSCHSCHVDGHSNGQLNDNFGDDSTGAPKRVLSLLGVAHTEPWAWNGNMSNLRSQIHKSIETTMRGPEPTDQQIEALAAYLGTLQPPPSVAKARGEVDMDLVSAGHAVFENRGCADCHQPTHYTSVGSFDVGIEDENGNVSFNPPSLLGVSQRDRLLHDNRADDLVAVLVEHSHGLDDSLPDDELEALVGFLRSL